MISGRQSGFVALVSVLVLGAIGVTLVVALLLLGLGASRTGLAFSQSQQAKALANTCVEEGLQQIRNSTAFAGSGNLTVGSGSCSYTVSTLSGESRQIIATGTQATAVRKVKVTISQINPTIVVSTWQEVADF